MENKEKELKLSDTELDEVDGGILPKINVSKPIFRCPYCKTAFKTQADLSRHKLNCAKGKL